MRRAFIILIGWPLLLVFGLTVMMWARSYDVADALVWTAGPSDARQIASILSDSGKLIFIGGWGWTPGQRGETEPGLHHYQQAPDDRPLRGAGPAWLSDLGMAWSTHQNRGHVDQWFSLPYWLIALAQTPVVIPLCVVMMRRKRAVKLDKPASRYCPQCGRPLREGETCAACAKLAH